jgi:WD40 repeat protein
LQPDGKKEKHFFPTHPNVTAVEFVALSPCLRYVAAAVRMDSGDFKAHCLVYAVEHAAPLHLRPAAVSLEAAGLCAGPLQFTSLCFSAQDADFLAGFTNVPQEGIVVLEWRTNSVVQRIPTKGFVKDLSFHPEDRFKLCSSGAPNLIGYWHFNQRYSNAAPVTGSKSHTQPQSQADLDRDYTCHVWLNKQQLLVGSTDGYVTLVKGCDIVLSKQAFLAEHEDQDMYVSVEKILVKADMVVVCSASNRVALFEVTRSTDAKSKSTGQDVPNISLVFVHRFILGPSNELRGIAWAYKNEFSNVLIAASSTSLGLFELDKSLEPETQPALLAATQVLCRFHSMPIQSAALPCKAGLFVSSSPDDGCVRVWALGAGRGIDSVTAVFKNGVGMPNCLDCHPSGHRIAFGCDDYYREYAITSDKLELMQEFPAKIAVTGPSGEAFVNTHPVSKIKYSNGGHLMAVVTGTMITHHCLSCLERSYLISSNSTNSKNSIYICMPDCGAEFSLSEYTHTHTLSRLGHKLTVCLFPSLTPSLTHSLTPLVQDAWRSCSARTT